MKARPIVLIFVGVYLPGYRAGGPIRTIANLVERLGDEFDFRIVCADRDFQSETAYSDVKLDAWNGVGKAQVFYASKHSRSLRGLRRLLRDTPHDVLYLNSFFDPRFTQQVLLNCYLGRARRRPIVLAPRGEFSPSALRLGKLKKYIFISFAKWTGLYDGIAWQASSPYEAQDVQRALSVPLRSDAQSPPIGAISVVPNLSSAEKPIPVVDKGEIGRCMDAPLELCFLARISPMKNLDFALRILGLVSVRVRFSIYGPIENAAYWADCLRLIDQLPDNIEVAQYGAVEPAQVSKTLARHDLFLLPTRGENFGHVIHEALRAGLPLLISDRTPWRNLEEKGVGWDLALDDMEGFVKKIEDASQWSVHKRMNMSSNARKLAEVISSDEVTINANRRLFLDCIDEYRLYRSRVTCGVDA